MRCPRGDQSALGRPGGVVCTKSLGSLAQACHRGRLPGASRVRVNRMRDAARLDKLQQLVTSHAKAQAHGFAPMRARKKKHRLVDRLKTRRAIECWSSTSANEPAAFLMRPRASTSRAGEPVFGVFHAREWQTHGARDGEAQGHIIFTGATARCAAAQLCRFSGAKRACVRWRKQGAELAARIHVANVCCGAIDTALYPRQCSRAV